jgi:PmbA protein
MTQSLPDLTQALLFAARAAGAEAADALAVDGTSVSIDVRGGALEHAERSEGIEIGLRVMMGKRQACVSASDTSPETLAQMAERAVAMAREAPEDPVIGQADADQLAQSWDLDALELAEAAEPPTPAELQDMAARAEAAALAHDGIAQVSDAGAGYGARRMHLAMSNGFSGGYHRTGTSLSVVAITGTGTGMERDYYGDSRIHAGDMDTPEDIGRIAAERTLQRAGARKPPTGAYPVLYDERIANSLIGHLMMAINGSSVVRGASFLRDAMDTPVLPDGMTLWEDPSLPRINGSRPFDGEGLPVTRRDLVADGVLRSWVLDLATGRKLGLPSTGNAARGTSAPPSPSVSNLRITQGTKTQAELLADMGTGLLITSMIGSSVNSTTGDYSRGASGFWVENGEITYPVNECTVAGNLRDMLRTMTPANDARMHLTRAIPSMLVEGLTIAGA